MSNNEASFNNEEFQELLHTYETSKNTGEQPFMDVDDLVDIADYYSLNNRDDEAMEVIDYALQLFPYATLPNVFMARNALSQKDIETAKEYLNRIEEKGDPDYHYLVAEIMIAEEKIEEADRYLRTYMMNVSVDEYQDYIKDCANLFIDYDISDKAFQWMMRSKGDDSKDFKELMARILAAVGKYKESEKLLNELLELDPYSINYWNALAGIQLQKGDYADALTSSEYAIAINPENIEALIMKANALQHLQNYKEAMKYYHKYVEAVPDDESGYMQLALCEIYLERKEYALPYLKKALSVAKEDSPNLPLIYQNMAFCYSALKQPEKAIEIIEKIKDDAISDSEFLIIKGYILLENGELGQVGEIWQKAISYSKDPVNTILRIVYSMYDNDYVQGAYNMLKNFLDRLPKETDLPSEIYPFMALCCHDLGNKEEFLMNLNIAVQKDPKETKNMLGFLFPPAMDVEDYYDYYMTH